jgi:hypothetical protein
MSSDPLNDGVFRALTCLSYADVSFLKPPLQGDSRPVSVRLLVTDVGRLSFTDLEFDKGCETKPSCTGAESDVRCIRRSSPNICKVSLE